MEKTYENKITHYLNTDTSLAGRMRRNQSSPYGYMSQALQNASTKADHEALAEHYEEAAAEMQIKVEEYKKLLASMKPRAT